MINLRSKSLIIFSITAIIAVTVLIASALSPKGQATEIAHYDLDYDGSEESIYVRSESDEVYTLQVIDTNGRLLWEAEAGLVHPGRTTYMLYSDGDSRGILQYTPYANQGIAGYNYRVSFLDGSETPEYLQGKLTFPLDSNNLASSDIDVTAEEIISFLEDINYLLERSAILLSTEDGQLIIGPQVPQHFINDNMDLIRIYRNQAASSYDVAEEMKKVTAADITELVSLAFTREEIASALNAASENQLTESEASDLGFDSLNHLFWDEKAYLEGTFETGGISGANLAFRMECGLTENIVKVSFGKSNHYATGYFESEELYTLLRYQNRPKYGEINQKSLDKFHYILKNQMDSTFSIMSESQPTIYAYELIEFYQIWSYEESADTTVELYNFDYGLLVNDPEKISFAGGMHFDGYERLRGFNGGGQLAVRYRNGELVSYSFMGNDFGYVPGYPEYDDICKERIKSALDFAESPSSYTEE